MNEKARNIQGNTQTNRTKRVRTHQSMNYLKKEQKKIQWNKWAFDQKWNVKLNRWEFCEEFFVCRDMERAHDARLYVVHIKRDGALKTKRVLFFLVEQILEFLKSIKNNYFQCNRRHIQKKNMIVKKSESKWKTLTLKMDANSFEAK